MNILALPKVVRMIGLILGFSFLVLESNGAMAKNKQTDQAIQTNGKSKQTQKTKESDRCKGTHFPIDLGCGHITNQCNNIHDEARCRATSIVEGNHKYPCVWYKTITGTDPHCHKQD